MPKAQSEGDAPSSNVSPELIAEALAEMIGFDVQISSLAGRKGAAIKKYEAQGVDREVLRALVTLARKDEEGAKTYIMSLTGYAIAAQVIPLADSEWTKSVTQADFSFAPATGAAADEIARARAFKQGHVAGRKGHLLAANPYNHKVGSSEFVGWRDGHGDGAALRKEIKPDGDKVKTASTETGRRRGRPSNVEKAAKAALEAAAAKGRSSDPGVGAVDQDAINQRVADEMDAINKAADRSVH